MTHSQRPRYEDVQDILKYQLSRRGVLGAGSALAMGGLLSACSGGGGSYTDESRGDDKPKQTMEVEIGDANIPTPREKTLVVAQADFTVFDNWNNLVPNGAPGASGFDIMVKEYMFYLNLATGELMPWLCTDYSYNDDFTQLTFTFDEKVKWNDGEPMTSEDFKFTLELLRDRPDLIGGGGDLKDFVKTVSAPDPQTAVLDLLSANPRLHYHFIAMILGAFDIKPKHVWEGKDPLNFRDDPPVRTGPYVLKDAIQSQKLFAWEKNPDYWNKEKLDPKVEFIVYRSTAEQADAAALAFEKVEIDVGSIDEEHAKQLRTRGYPNLITTQFNDPCPRALWLNCDPKRGLIAEPKMHWAINYLIDRKKIGQNVWPVEVPPAQYPWADFPSNEQWAIPELAEEYEFRYDPDAAEKLLDEIAPKGEDGKRAYDGKPARIEFITPVPVDGYEYVIAKLVKEELVELGIGATLRSLSGSVADKKWQLGQFDVYAQWVCDVERDPAQLYRNLRSDFAKPIGENAVSKNNVRYSNPEMDKLAKQLGNLDPTSEEAKPLLKQALEIYYQDLPVAPVIQTGYPQYYNTTFWTGWPTDEDLYQVPLNWWGHFMFIIGRLEPTGQAAP